MSDAIESTAVDVEPVIEPEQPMALARRERRSEVIRPLNTEALVESFAAYQALLPQLLNDGDYQDAGRGKRFVKKSGWRKIATAFDLDVQLIRSTVERDEHGAPTRAEVWARAIAPSGRSMDGDGYCSVDEDRFSGPRGNKSKLENDLRATATTRAMNRAISGLVGMGEVSAEEIGGQDYGKPPYGDPVPQDQRQAVGQAIGALIGTGDANLVQAVAGQIIKDAGGYFPAIVAQALTRVQTASMEQS